MCLNIYPGNNQKFPVSHEQNIQTKAGSHQFVLVDVPGDLSDEDLAAFAGWRANPVGRGAAENTKSVTFVSAFRQKQNSLV